MTPRRRVQTGVLLLLAGCPTPPYSYPPGPPSIERFTATPLAVSRGGVVTVEWSVEDAETIALAGAGPETLNVPPRGSIAFTPAATSSIALTAESSAGESTALLRILVFEDAAVAIERFDLSPRIAAPGDPIELTWKTRRAARVVISSSDDSFTFADAPEEGRHTFRPLSDVTVRIRAEGPGGPIAAERSARVRPFPPAILELRLLPSTIEREGEAQLVWRIARADTIRLTETASGSPSRILLDRAPAQGNLRISGSGGSRSITLEAANTSAMIEETIELTVLGRADPEVIRFDLVPQVTGRGGHVFASFATSGATLVTLRGATGPPIAAHATTGEVTLEAPDRDQPILLEAIHEPSGATATRTATLAVDPALPEIVWATASPVPFTPGETVTILWRTEGAAASVLTTDWGLTLQAVTSATGAFAFEPVFPQTLVVEASNPSGVTRRFLPLPALE